MMLSDLLYAGPSAVQFVIQSLICIAACALLLACICRVNRLYSKTHKRAWIICYIAYAAFAAALLIQILEGQRASDAHLFALLSLCLNIALTRKSWALRAPKIMEKL